MKVRKPGLLVLTCLYVLSLPVAAESYRFVYASYPPANYKTPDGKASGFFCDILRELIEKRLGSVLVMETYPWARCQVMVRDGSADIMATIPTPERLEYSVQTSRPFWVKEYLVWTWAGHPRAKEMDSIRSVNDILRDGLTVISYIGNDWSRITLEDMGVPVINAVSVEGMYQMLSVKRADILIEDPFLVYDSVSRKEVLDRIEATEGILGRSSFHFLVSKKSPLASRIAELDQALSDMLADGTIDRILGEYSGVR